MAWCYRPIHCLCKWTELSTLTMKWEESGIQKLANWFLCQSVVDWQQVIIERCIICGKLYQGIMAHSYEYCKTVRLSLLSSQTSTFVMWLVSGIKIWGDISFEYLNIIHWFIYYHCNVESGINTENSNFLYRACTVECSFHVSHYIGTCKQKALDWSLNKYRPPKTLPYLT